MVVLPSDNALQVVEDPLDPSARAFPSRYPRKRKRASHPSPLRPRQVIDQQNEIDAAKTTCELTANNAMLSCWPTSDALIVQNQYTQFVWNSRLPQYAQTNLVNIGLFRADSGTQVFSALNVTNPFGQAGFLPVLANDSWWDNDQWPGQNVTFPFSFIVVANDLPFSSGIPQSTFSAVQTTFANSVLATMSAASASSSAAAASLSSAAAASSSSASAASSSSVAASRSGSSGSIPGATGTSASGLQATSNGSSFPHWAIAVIVILGFFAILAFVTLVFLVLRTLRKRKDLSRRGSMGSQSPMMANAQAGGTSASPAYVAQNAGLAANAPTAGSVAADGASTHSETPFSTMDAAVMAEAFRNALRKPDFAAGTVDEGDGGENSPEPQDGALLSRELAEEGRGLQNVSKSREVRVEGMPEGSDGA